MYKYSKCLLNIKADQSQMKTHALKIEDLRDWLKYTGGSNQILSDQHLVFKINFDVRTLSESDYLKNKKIINFCCHL